MKLILPLILLLLGTGGGVAAGLFLAPPQAEEGMEDTALGPCGPTEETGSETMTEVASEAETTTGKEYARLNNQFVIPVVTNEAVVALVVVSLSVEVPAGQQSIVFEHEPKLRDAFLQVLFDHANLGGFDGQFTATSNMRNLRTALRNVARDAIGDLVSDVLILEMVRQDI